MKRIKFKIGFDVTIYLEDKNTFLTGKKDEMLRLKKKFGLNLLIVFPNLNCSTKKIFKKNKKLGLSKPQSFFNIKDKKQLIIYLKKQDNDLEETVTKIYQKVNQK